ncbi:MAG TPA: protein-glutamate O-methyltransferase CheR [Longimicrobiaceae bacterium]|jgi:chemotaxis methyl-accepting protein methylase|nr:protein-glutamate O-methyltransferase CheR [Longimicrobiaceae bacterium]
MNRPPSAPPPFLPLTLEGDDEELEKLKVKIERDRGFNCQFYKDKCLRRRIAVRMRARGKASFAEYGQLLDREPAEYETLLDTLTINVTKFFRNLETWRAVEQLVLPPLFDMRTHQLRVWSAGSSSGEEAYTVSILAREWAEKHGRGADLARLHVLGTDIDRRSLEAAQRGEYPDLSLQETPQAVRERWFSPGPPYRIRPEVQRNVAFVRRDLISEPPPPEQNLIFCRNVVIYFDREIQERLFKGFYDALVPGGFLVMGKVETLIGPARTLFRAVNNRERIFQKPA